MMNHQSVTSLVHQIKDLLEGEFRQVSVLGEITNLSSSASGHYYFTLSDKDASLSAVIFRADALRNPLIKKCQDGSKVFCQGSLGVYPKRGSFQLIVRNMAPAGQGDLKAQFEALKLKLAGHGLFDPDRKRPLPEKIRRVAVITAKGGAALQDFLNIYRRRSYAMDIVLIPSLVQGDAAAGSLVRALRRAIEYSLKNPDKAFDVIVLTRGGGSLEDLWAFNDEALAWEIMNSPIPIISAVGHQVDTSISDYVADIRAETPSAAAELLTENQMRLIQRLMGHQRLLSQRIGLMLRQYRHKRTSLSPRALFGLMKNRFLHKQHQLEKGDFPFRAQRALGLKEKWQKLDETLLQMQTKLVKGTEQHEKDLLHHYEKLQLLNPRQILGRGYAYTTDEKGRVVKGLKDFNKLDENQTMTLHFSDGEGQVRKLGSER